MQRIETDVQIAAAPQQVWRVLVDFVAYPAWSPRLTVAGRPEPGQRLLVTAAAPGEKGMRFTPRVLAAGPNSCGRSTRATPPPRAGGLPSRSSPRSRPVRSPRSPASDAPVGTWRQHILVGFGEAVGRVCNGGAEAREPHHRQDPPPRPRLPHPRALPPQDPARGIRSRRLPTTYRRPCAAAKSR